MRGLCLNRVLSISRIPFVCVRMGTTAESVLAYSLLFVQGSLLVTLGVSLLCQLLNLGSLCSFVSLAPDFLYLIAVRC